jgi:diaminohydroxyphosphoribosylaminopyrimidine deaminase / 5-amino-6-(5-phosphoribosylamino)uracil reductase
MSANTTEQDAMRRALSLAAKGPRGVNPQVGAVILSPAGDVLAAGWHRGAGTVHAEVDALSQLAEGDARGATAVVTLEPCNHTGRTGPCSEALITAGVARVLYAVADPNPQSRGGADRLRRAGVDVEAGLLEPAATDLLASWLAVQRLGRPHVTVKWAQSLDGRAAAPDGTSRWITGPEARADVHRRRAEADAIVVGIGTVLADDPALTARRADGSLFEHQPLPVVLGDRPVPDGAALQRHPHRFLRRSGVDLPAVLAELRERGAQRVFVEGGPTIASAFLRADLVDEVLVYVAPTLIGSGAGGADRPALGHLGVDTIGQQHRLDTASVERLGDDLLIVATPRRERRAPETTASMRPEETAAVRPEETAAVRPEETAAVRPEEMGRV